VICSRRRMRPHKACLVNLRRKAKGTAGWNRPPTSCQDLREIGRSVGTGRNGVAPLLRPGDAATKLPLPQARAVFSSCPNASAPETRR
jgi:hypothetical protein